MNNNYKITTWWNKNNMTLLYSNLMSKMQEVVRMSSLKLYMSCESSRMKRPTWTTAGRPTTTTSPTTRPVCGRL